MSQEEARGRLEAIWLKRVRGGPMDAVEEAILEEGRGIAGNANQGGRRQVTIIEREVWEQLLDEVGGDADPSGRRANLMVSGVPLRDGRGKELIVGSCRIRIMGETMPCEQMDRAAPGLHDAMRGGWRGGAFGVILEGGTIRRGDPVLLAPPPGHIDPGPDRPGATGSRSAAPPPSAGAQ